MIPVEEAVDIVLREVRPLSPKPVSFAQALSLVLAEDVHAAEPMPPFAASAVDGYAIIAADMLPARQLIGEQLAGRVNDLQVSPGTAVRITTGAPVPPGADAVVMVEYTREEPDGQVQVEAPVEAGDNVRPVGQDLEVGQLVLPQGTLLGAAEIGLLAMVGRTEVHAYPRPRIAVMSTGDELLEPGQSH
jgi:molybdopterin biosynthesis enzyme